MLVMKEWAEFLRTIPPGQPPMKRERYYLLAKEYDCACGRRHRFTNATIVLRQYGWASAYLFKCESSNPLRIHLGLTLVRERFLGRKLESILGLMIEGNRDRVYDALSRTAQFHQPLNCAFKGYARGQVSYTGKYEREDVPSVLVDTRILASSRPLSDESANSLERLLDRAGARRAAESMWIRRLRRRYAKV